jgi:transcriptional regulator with XRE-family HTH domain
MLLRHAIGHVLRRLRLEQGKTLRQLAQASRVSLPYLSEIERGRKEASSEILATVCRVLDVSLGDLLDDVSRELALGEVTAVLEVTSMRNATVEIDAATATSRDGYLMAA